MNPAPVPIARRVAALALPAMLLACGGGASSSPSPGPVATAVPTATSATPATVGPPPSPTPPDDSSPLTLDATLLAYLPAAIDDVAVTEDVDEAATALSDPALPRIASAVDGAVAVDTGAGDLVYAWIVRLRPGVFTDADFRQWRDSYDEGACAGAGGVVGRAEATIGGRQSFVTSCVAGMHTYHLWLEDLDVLISASSVGAGRFGERLLEGLRLPS